MDTALEDIAFLARSENRVAIFRALADRPRDRRELETETGVSRSTLGRALGDLEERGWIERDGRTYETTTAGELVLDRFVPLFETMAGLRTLGTAIELLPVEDISLDIRHLADAKVVTATEFQPTKPMDYSLDRQRDANQLCAVVRTIPPVALAATHEMVTSGQLDATFVLDSAYVDTLSPAGELQAQWSDMATGPATIRCHEGPIPYVLLAIDETVHLWPCDDEGDTWGLLESENDSVLAWAEGTIADYLDEAQSLETELSACTTNGRFSSE